MDTRTAKLEEIDIVYDVFSSSTADNQQTRLVFIHGYTCSAALWKHSPELLHRYPSIVIDLPGHGRSSRPQIDYTIELMAESVIKVLTNEGIAKAVLVGHSLGGPVATMALRLQPQFVRSIIYVDSFFELPESYLSFSARQELMRSRMDDNEFLKKVRSFWTAKTTPEIKDLVENTMMGTATHVRLSTTTTAVQPHAWKWNEVYQIPALLLVAPMFAKIDRQWLHHMPNLEVHIWDEHGHFLFMEDPDRFSKEVESFVSRHQLEK